MEITNEQRAEVLVHALPYIQKYYGKVIVIKYGGNAMIDDNLKDNVMQDLVLLQLIGMKVVLVHGGGPEINAAFKAYGKETIKVDGLRYTDEEGASIVQMVLAGKVNKDLVKLLGVRGGKAIGLSGMDGKMIQCSFKDKDKYGFVGQIDQVNPEVIYDALDNGYIPVISTVGIDLHGNSYNINADTAAAQIAGALKAEAFIAMTDIKGLLRDKNDESSLIHRINVSELTSLAKQGIIDGGMIPKVECCVEAIRRGVHKVFIIDGRVPHSILIELMTDEGIGTMFK
ncbi:MAG: acetylglutamate kinase [Anaeroplasmataceae bacterium]